MTKEQVLLEQSFKVAQEIVASRGYKIFTPNRKYFRARRQVVAVLPVHRRQTIILQLRARFIIIRFLAPTLSDASLAAELSKKLGKQLKVGAPLFKDWNTPWSACKWYIIPSQHEEFKLLIK